MFIVLVILSLISLASGARGGVLGSGIKTVVGVAVMPFLTALNAVEGGSEYVSGMFKDYDTLREELDTYSLKFAELQQETSEYYELQAENARLREMLDFQRISTQYQLMPAEVIQHSQGVLTVDRGSIHGIRESMCVVTPEGIVGLVTHVGPFTSNIITLQNATCRIDAMIEWNRVRGQVQGTGNYLSSVCAMHYIDLNDNVSDNDLVVTSPDSIFPSGFPIGRIKGMPTRGGLAQSANIVPFADPFRLDEVFILLRADSSADALAGPDVAQQEMLRPTELIDTASVQERYAP